jgi:hypothetical protein
MQTVLSKFEKVEVDHVSRLEKEDQAFCEHQQRLYEDAKGLYEWILPQMEARYKTYQGESWNLSTSRSVKFP